MDNYITSAQFSMGNANNSAAVERCIHCGFQNFLVFLRYSCLFQGFLPAMFGAPHFESQTCKHLANKAQYSQQFIICVSINHQMKEARRFPVP